MKPLRLLLRAFGPYADEQIVDFRQLGGRSLFLIHGPTGSGKTTILDAICFALYGDTSGAEREGRQMRSDHADPSVLTEVTLDFSLGAESFRVTRRPEQQRAKKRGGGTTLERAQAFLWRRTGTSDDAEEGTLLATQWSKVTEEIERLFGFRSDQFRQVVILPQGQFRRLLMANSKEREEILEVLFRTEFYRHIEERLKQSAKELSDQICEARTKQRAILQHAEVTSIQELEHRRDKIGARLQELEHRLEVSRQAERSAQERWHEGQQALHKLREREQAETEFQSLTSRQDEMASKRATLERAQRAATLTQAEVILRRRLEEAQSEARRLNEAQQALRQARLSKEEAERALATERAREDEREEASRQLMRLEQFTTKVRELDDARGALRAAQQEVNQKTQERDALKLTLQHTQRQLEAKQRAKDEADKLALRLEDRIRAVDEAQRKLHQRKQLDKLRQSLSVAHDELQRTQAELQARSSTLAQEREQLQTLEAIWIEAQAAILARQLVPGRPCPVCGSTEHPKPAHFAHVVPTETALKDKRQTIQRLESELDQIRKTETQQQQIVTRFHSQVDMLQDGLGQMKDIALSQLESHLRQADLALAEANAAKQRVPLLEEEIERLKQQEATTKDQLDQVEKELQAAILRQERWQAVVSERQNELPPTLQDQQALDQAKQQAAQRLHALKQSFENAQRAAKEANEHWAAAQAKLTAAEAAATEAQKRAQAEQQEFVQRLRGAGFADQAEFEQSRLSWEQMAHLDREINEFEANWRAAQTRLERAQQAARGLTAPDLDVLERAAVQAKKNLEALAEEKARLEERYQQIVRWLDQWHQEAAQLESLEKRYAIIGRLADVANGRNARGTTFQRFVLSALLDDVLIVASQRLRLMSRGRFQLHRAHTRADHRTAGGLDLEVYDTYTGTARPISTLSGGESFLASLSLALGLADVVQSYAGGIRLETIFIDEGFGSLDPEALDLALRALIDLQQGGRLVGIISHVPELKERIDARLQVDTDKNGRSIARLVI